MAYNSTKPHLGVIVLGHDAAGKSTIAGRLLRECGRLHESVFRRIEEDARRDNKLTSLYAYIMERLKYGSGDYLTADIQPYKFYSTKHSFSTIDASENHNLIKNMITGTSHADVAMMVVSAAKGEPGIREPGQTLEHAFLAYTLGIRQVLVLVNKMDSDTANYSQERYEEVRQEISAYLSIVGYAPEMITFMPVSGWTGENVTTKSDKLSWYNGPTLLEALDTLEKTDLKDLPLRVSVQDVYRIGGIGTVVVGRVETGVLTVKDQITVAPGNLNSYVKSIEKCYETVDEAIPGDVISFSIRGLSRKDVRRGSVIGHTYNEPPYEAIDFVAQILILNDPGEMREGYTPLVECHASHVQCKFTELLAKYDKRSGEVVEAAPNIKMLQKGDWALVRLEPIRAMIVEPFTEFAPLGRVVVRAGQQTIAIGVIKSVNKKSN